MKATILTASILFGLGIYIQYAHAYEYSGYKWSSIPVTYYINENGTPDASDEFTAIQNAFQTWENTNTQSMNFTYGGTQLPIRTFLHMMAQI